MNKKSNHASEKNWFGAIPSNWEARRIKTLFSVRDERNYLPLEEVNLISLYSGVGVMQHSDIEHTTGNKARNADGYKIVKQGDIIVNILLCWMGAIGRSDYDGVTSPAYDIYIPNGEINSRYYHYLFRIPAFSQQCYRAGKGIMAMRLRTYSPQFRNIVVPYPPREEQDQIVRFLDWKISLINKLRGFQYEEIKRLEEIKMLSIQRATTLGLRNSHCSKNNDARWCIICPNHWQISRMRELFSFRKGLSITKADLRASGIPVISYGQVHSKDNSGVCVSDDLIRYVDESYMTSDKNALVNYGDFIFADTSEDVTGCGNCVYVDRDDSLFAGYHTIIAHAPSLNINKYLAYLFKTPVWRQQIRKKVNGVKVYSITQKILKDAFVLVPPGDEQAEIVKYLDDVCQKIDDAIEKARERILRLQELKSNLISTVIVGKIDVRGIEVPEYEYVPDSMIVETEDEEEAERMED